MDRLSEDQGVPSASTNILVGGASTHPSRFSQISSIPQPKPQDHVLASIHRDQHAAEMLAKYGIKVRDFLYEGTSPPVVIKTLPRQIVVPRQPIPPDAAQPGTSTPSLTASIGQPLERKVTEPVDPAEPPHPTRQVGFADLSGLLGLGPPADVNEYPPLPATPRRQVRTRPPIALIGPTDQPMASPSFLGSACSPSSQSQSQGVCQDSERWINTPLVTPKGSLHWPVSDHRALPAPRLAPPPQPIQDAVDLTFAQMEFSPDGSRGSRQNSRKRPDLSPTTAMRRDGPPSLPDLGDVPFIQKLEELPLDPHTAPFMESKRDALEPRYNLRRRVVPAPPASSGPTSHLRDARVVPSTRRSPSKKRANSKIGSTSLKPLRRSTRDTGRQTESG